MTPGNKSTEFWMLVAFMLTVLANGTEYVNVPDETIRFVGGMVGVYVGGRSWVKAKASTPVAATPKRGEPQ